MMTQNRSAKILNNLRKYYGPMGSALNYTNLYELAVSVVLSAQTTDRQVNQTAPALFAEFPDFKRLSKARVEKVESLIRSIGLYKTKAKNIVNMAKIVTGKFNNSLPDNFDDLVTLPGVGRKSANVILAMGFKKPAFPVDTHVLRIANRIGYIKSDSPIKVEKELTAYIPEHYWIEAHLLFINHGRKICFARKPLCPECPINRLCDFANNIS